MWKHFPSAAQHMCTTLLFVRCGTINFSAQLGYPLFLSTFGIPLVCHMKSTQMLQEVTPEKSLVFLLEPLKQLAAQKF